MPVLIGSLLLKLFYDDFFVLGFKSRSRVLKFGITLLYFFLLTSTAQQFICVAV